MQMHQECPTQLPHALVASAKFDVEVAQDDWLGALTQTDSSNTPDLFIQHRLLRDDDRDSDQPGRESRDTPPQQMAKMGWHWKLTTAA